MTAGAEEYLVVEFTPNDQRRFVHFVGRVARLLKWGRTKIIIHFLNDMEFSPDALRVLHRLLKMGRLRFADIRVVVPSEKMRETFLLTRLDIFTRIYDSVEEAKREKGFMPFIKYGSVAAAGILLFFYWDVVRWLVFSWRIDPYYSHGFLVAAVSVFLLWKRRQEMRSPVSCVSFKSLSLVSGSFLLYLAGCFLEMKFLLGLSLIGFLLGAVLLLYGKAVYRQVFLPAVLLFFAVPVPRLDEAASFLQHHTAAWTTRVVSVFGVAAYNIGVNVFFGESHIVIDAPCSGLRSLIALMFVGSLFIGLLRAFARQKLALLLSIIPIAILANLLRITVLVLIANSFGLKAAMFYFHYLSGLLFFSIALSMLFLEKKVLKCGLQAF